MGRRERVEGGQKAVLCPRRALQVASHACCPQSGHRRSPTMAMSPGASTTAEPGSTRGKARMLSGGRGRGAPVSGVPSPSSPQGVTKPPVVAEWRVRAAPREERPQSLLHEPHRRVGGCGGNPMGRCFDFSDVSLITF